MSDRVPRAESVAARIVTAFIGSACVLVGIVSLPLPLFPSLLFVLIGFALIARSSLRVRRWLFAQARFSQALSHVKNERAQQLLARLLGTA